MLKIDFSHSAPLLLALASTLMGCGSDASPTPSNSDAGANSGGASSEAGASAGGASSTSGASAGGASSGGASAAGASTGGADTGGASAGGAPSTSPCNYAASGGQTFPEGDAMYLCTIISRLLQQKGQGDYDLLFGGAFSTTDKHTSTIACSLSSKDPPAAGDTWTLGPDHPGNCDLSYSQGTTASLWKSSDTPAGTGSASVKFLSATLKHGTSKPEDVYYLFEVELTATMPGETPNTPEVTLNGTFKFTSLPLGA